MTFAIRAALVDVIDHFLVVHANDNVIALDNDFLREPFVWRRELVKDDEALDVVCAPDHIMEAARPLVVEIANVRFVAEEAHWLTVFGRAVEAELASKELPTIGHEGSVEFSLDSEVEVFVVAALG